MQSLRWGAILAAAMLALGACGSEDPAPVGAGGSGGTGGVGGTGGTGGIGGSGGIGGTGGGGAGGSVEPACDDGEKNGDETGVDCGGSCATCENGSACDDAGDCTSGICAGGVCVAPSCDDGSLNGDESDVDCGGTCTACDVGDACRTGSDCASASCVGGTCAAPTCGDQIRNGDEAGVDCGGSCPVCANGATCTTGADCASGVCSGNVCVAASCTDQVKNGDETDVDCGGSCADCAIGDDCGVDADCASGACVNGACVAATCADGRLNGGESDVDCGGSCAPCAEGAACVEQSDCASGLCENAVCVLPVCENGVKDGDESDVDCGGTCDKCADGDLCLQAADCTSGVCYNGLCAVPACDDTVKNGNETGVDCGGACTTGCAAGDACNVNGDCQSGTCTNNVCVAPFCGDGRVNQPTERCDLGISNGGTQCTTTCQWAYSVPVVLVPRDVANARSIRMYDPNDGHFIRDFVINSSLLNASGTTLWFATMAPDGTIWVADRGHKKIYRFDKEGQYVDTIIDDATLTSMGGFDFRNGDVFIGRQGGIARYNATTGAFVGLITAGQPFANATVSDIEFLPDGTLVSASYDRLNVFSADYSTATQVATISNTTRQITLMPNGTLLVVGTSSEFGDAMRRYQLNGSSTASLQSLGFSEHVNSRGAGVIGKGLLISQGSTDFSSDRLRIWDATANTFATENTTNLQMFGKAEVSPSFVQP